MFKTIAGTALLIVLGLAACTNQKATGVGGPSSGGSSSGSSGPVTP